MIKLEGIEKTYQTGKIEFKALRGVDLFVSEGEYTSIMGPSGSGKSTMMNILGCLDSLTGGKYFLDDCDVSKLSQKELAKVRNEKIGFVFQSFNLLPKLTILQNVELPMLYAGVSKRKRKEKATYLLEKVGLGGWVKHRPSEISGGQRQRVAIARALVCDPSIILADEPTGNLDSESSYEIMGIFQQLNDEGSTIVMVTHEPDIANHTKRIVRFFDGKIVADEVVENRTLIRN